MTVRKYLSVQSMTRLLTMAGYFVFANSVSAQTPRWADCEAADLLPETIVACAEVSNLGGALETVLSHPLRAKLEAMPAYAAIMKSDQQKQLQVGINAFEANMKMPWQKAIAIVCDRGATVAIDATDNAIAVLLHSTDEEALERFRNFVLVARMLQGGISQQSSYRGLKADRLNDNLRMVRVHDWLLLTNKSELGRFIIDQYLDQKSKTLAQNEKYASAVKSLKSNETKRLVSAYVDIEKIRSTGIAKNVYNERVDNFFVELLVGGVLANLQHTGHAVGTLDIARSGLTMQVSTPHQRDWESPREYFFGSPTLAPAPTMLRVSDRLFALSAHRDISQLWVRCGDLLTDKANDQLAVADTQLTTFFAGRDFGEDILGSLESDIQIVGKAPDFTDLLPQPTIKLPTFAIEFQMKNPEETQPELRRVFQAFVGFLTITGAMNGQPQLDLGMEREGTAQLVTATFVPKQDQRESRDAPIQFNFSPTLAFAGKRVVLSSSTQLARELIGLDNASKAENENASNANTVASVDVATLQKILQSNKSQLVANNMLEKGHSKAAAEGEISFLIDLVGFLRQAGVSLSVNDSVLTLATHIDVNLPEDSEHE